MNILCKACKADSGVPAPESTYSVGDYVKKTGFAWIPDSNSESFWICRTCAQIVLDHVMAIQALLGKEDTYIYLPTLQCILEKALEDGFQKERNDAREGT